MYKYIYQNWEIFGHGFSNTHTQPHIHFLGVHPTISLIWNSNYLYVRCFDIIYRGPSGSFFSLFSMFDISVNLSSDSLTLTSVISNLLSSLYNKYFISNIVFAISRVFISSLKLFLFIQCFLSFKSSQAFFKIYICETGYNCCFTILSC